MSTRISYSAATFWRDCQQRYWYRYEKRITTRQTAPSLSLGRWLHSYLERYYRNVKDGLAAREAHEEALHRTVEQYHQELIEIATIAAAVDEKLATEVSNVEAVGKKIATNYFRSRGKDDSERYQVLLVEQPVDHLATDNIRVPGVIDLVVRDLDRGVLQLWDHKTTTTIPRNDHILDTQLMLYAAMLHEAGGIEVDELVWNYLRSKPPTVPTLTKQGKLSRDKSIDTDFATFMEAIRDNALNPTDYIDTLRRLKDADKVNFFPRHQQPVMPEAEDVILGDFIRTLEDIEAARATPDFRPIRNIGRGCNWCEYRKVCSAVVTGGDPEEVIRLGYDSY